MMSRTDIPVDRALSEADRAYLLMRGEDSRVKWFDQTYPPGAEEDGTGEEDELPDYESWTVPQLNDRINELNAEGAEIVAASTKKADLIEALREYDALPEDPEEE